MSQYLIKHWAEDGERSGATVVVASSPRMALHLLKLHFDEKPNGYRQYHRMDMLEVELYEDSMLADQPLTDDTPGVKAEYVIERSGRVTRVSATTTG